MLLRKTIFFLGHSIGGLICFELAKKLHQLSLPKPEHLIISATKAPHVPLHREPIHNLPDKEFIEQLKIYNGIPEEILNQNNELLNLMLPILRADFSLLENYKHKCIYPLPCSITTFSGINDPTVKKKDIVEWKHYTQATFTCTAFSGDHFFIKSSSDRVINYIKKILEAHFDKTRLNF